jgi:hypothetical protein
LCGHLAPCVLVRCRLPFGEYSISKFSSVYCSSCNGSSFASGACPFYISRYEVTQKQFRDVRGGLTQVDGDSTILPATSNPWQPCLDDCTRLTNTGINIPEGATVRLPTEAECEYAFRFF